MSDAVKLAMDLSNAIKNENSFAINPEKILVLTEELLRLSEAVREAREIFEDMSPHLKMSETIGTLTRRTEIQGNKALAWLEKYGSEK